jgi:hypothetical protein
VETLADAFSKLQDGINKDAIAMAVLGRGGHAAARTRTDRIGACRSSSAVTPIAAPARTGARKRAV